MPITALSKGLAADDDEATVSTDDLPNMWPNTVMVDDELITVVDVMDDGTMVIERGAYGTTPSDHSKDADIHEVSNVQSREEDILVTYIDTDAGTGAIRRIEMSITESEPNTESEPEPEPDTDTDATDEPDTETTEAEPEV